MTDEPARAPKVVQYGPLEVAQNWGRASGRFTGQAFVVQEDGTLKNKRLFCNLGSDGMTIDDEGNVYLTGRGVTVFDKTGKQVAHIDIQEPWTANVCFGGKDRHTLFITASKSLYSMQMRTGRAGSQ